MQLDFPTTRAITPPEAHLPSRTGNAPQVPGDAQNAASRYLGSDQGLLRPSSPPNLIQFDDEPDQFTEFKSGAVHAQTQTDESFLQAKTAPQPFQRLLADDNHFAHLIGNQESHTSGGLDVNKLNELAAEFSGPSKPERDSYLAKTAFDAYSRGLETFNPTQELMDAVIGLRKAVLENSKDRGTPLNWAQYGQYTRSKNPTALSKEQVESEHRECLNKAMQCDAGYYAKRFVSAYKSGESALPPTGEHVLIYGPTHARAIAALEKHYGTRVTVAEFHDNGYLPEKYTSRDFAPLHIPSIQLEDAVVKDFRNNLKRLTT